MTKKISVFCIIYAILLLTAVLAPALLTGYRAYARESVLNMTEQECIEFIEENDVVIPDVFQNDDESLGRFVKNTIDCVADNPNCFFAYNFYPTLKFAEDIKALVVNRCQLDCLAEKAVSRASSYTLQDSLVQNSNGDWVGSGGAWEDRWFKYNCYAYSINRFESPQFYSSNWLQYHIGTFSNIKINSLNGLSIQYLANAVKEDLQSLKHSNVEISTSIPSITKNENLICIRRGAEDYHFMRYDLQTDAWYHKPGNTAVLKYKYVPSNDRVWIAEGSQMGVEVYNGGRYDSDILFIKYTKNILPLTNISKISMDTSLNAGMDCMYEVDVGSADNYSFNLTSNASLKVRYFDQNMDLINTYTGTNVTFSKEYANSGKYYIGVSFESKDDSGSFYMSVTNIHSYSGHYCKYCSSYTSSNHLYNDKYVWVSNTKHNAFCSCGLSVEKGHVVRTGTKLCLQCKGRADMGVVVDPLRSKSVLITANGSCVLPSGVIVLQDADLEAYFNGELKFYLNDVKTVA